MRGDPAERCSVRRLCKADISATEEPDFQLGLAQHPVPRTNTFSPMRRTSILFVFLAFLLVPSTVAQPTVSVRGNAGAAFFQSPEGLNTILNSGVDLGLSAGVQVYGGLELVLEGSYDRFTMNGDNIALLNEGLDVGSRIRGGALNVLGGKIGMRYTLRNPSDAHPYVSGGIGLYRSVLEEAYYQNDEILRRLATRRKGYHVAIGTNFRIDDTYAFFFEPRLVIIDTNGSELDTPTSTRYVTVLIGLEMKL